MDRLTAGQLRKAIDYAIVNKKYLALRWDNNLVTGCNPKAVLIGMKDKKYWEESSIVSYYLISFNEYITTKIKFV